MEALHPTRTAVSLEVEAVDAGAVDDVVTRRQHPPHTYVQVKYAVDATTAVDTDYLLAPTSKGGPSLLKRFHTSWLKLRDQDSQPNMQLVTSREADPTDAVLALRDRRTELLTPGLQQAPRRGAARKLAQTWADHLDIDMGVLDAMLANLRFATGRSFAAEQERASSLMLANGLAGDANAVRSGIALVADWVATGRRRLTVEELRTEVDSLRLHTTEPFDAVLVVSAIDTDPHPEDATVALDWTAHFDGDSPYQRRAPRDLGVWSDVTSRELGTAADQLRASGTTRVLIRGAMRLPAWFAVGAQLRQVEGWEVACAKPAQHWRSDTPAGPTPNTSETHIQIDRGAGIAVAVGISADPTGDVHRHLKSTNANVDRLVTILPDVAPGDQAITGPADAVAWARAIRDRTRTLVSESDGAPVHLFLAAPAGLALLLGHRWNRVTPTTIYEDLGAGQGYIPMFTVEA